ncbi:hypothetical protein V9L05_04000 [Bernardetia sp. Wsw4-3y2]|uniref:hypothetical protein n=1 Tax=unclassified Bernardetia TaxID=2647129 RepID=UPI0030D02CE3
MNKFTKFFLLYFLVLFVLCIANFVLAFAHDEGTLEITWLGELSQRIFLSFKYPFFLVEEFTENDNLLNGSLFYVALILNILTYTFLAAGITFIASETKKIQ